MAKNKTSEFVKWFGPLLDALRDLGYSGKPKEVSDTIAKKLNVPGIGIDVVANFFFSNLSAI